MSGPRLIITRPQPDADRWVARLVHANVKAVALPLIEITPLQCPEVAAARNAMEQYAAVMFSSPAAARSLLGSNGEFVPAASVLTALRFMTTGPGTTQTLLSLGIPSDSIDTPDGQSTQFDSEALWSVIAERPWQGQSVLIARGLNADADPVSASDCPDQLQGHGRNWLANRLRSSGAQVETLAVYERRPPHWTPTQQLTAQEAVHDGSIWVFSSSESLHNLSHVLPDTSWARVPCVCTHPRIAETTRQMGFTRITTCRPSLSDLLSHCHAQ